MSRGRPVHDYRADPTRFDKAELLESGRLFRYQGVDDVAALEREFEFKDFWILYWHSTPFSRLIN